jgi:hypothetical protein
MKILYTLNNFNKVDSVQEYQEGIIIPEGYFLLEITEEDYNNLISRYGYIIESNKIKFVGENEIEKNNTFKNNRLHEIKKILVKNRKMLEETDYKIIKCYEAFMRQQPLPYNLEELSAQRDSWRAEINQLEEELKAL